MRCRRPGPSEIASLHQTTTWPLETSDTRPQHLAGIALRESYQALPAFVQRVGRVRLRRALKNTRHLGKN